jgi:hypothetical protein
VGQSVEFRRVYYADKYVVERKRDGGGQGGLTLGNSCYHAGARVLLCSDICYVGTEVR